MSKKRNTPEKEERAEKRAARLRKIGTLLFVLLLCWAIGYGANNRLEVSEYEFQHKELPLSFNGFRIVQLSDLHNKTFAEDNAPLLTRIEALHPNLIVLTGDIVDGSTHTNVNAALHTMEQVAQIAPTVYVYGNHEHQLEREVLADYEQRVAACGVKLLTNEEVQIVSDRDQTFTLIGMDDNALQSNFLGTLAEKAPDEFTLLLAHEPQYLDDYYAPAGVDLVLSGHAHGGQFRIPCTHQGLLAPDEGIFPKLTEGLHYSGDTGMIISRGLGNSAFPLRQFNHPEIVCVTLRPAKE